MLTPLPATSNQSQRLTKHLIWIVLLKVLALVGLWWLLHREPIKQIEAEGVSARLFGFEADLKAGTKQDDDGDKHDSTKVDTK